MKILQVLNHFLPQQTAGTEVYTWMLSKKLLNLGFEITVIIPHYGSHTSSCYQYDGIEVVQYAEPTKVDRLLILGKKKPEGLQTFHSYIEKNRPEIIHFHELAGSNGITHSHVKVAKASGAKIVMTFHLSGYTCRTGTMIYKEKELCDGIIDIARCSACYLHSKGQKGLVPLLLPISNSLNKLKIDTTSWNNRIGTALGTGFIIEQLKQSFFSLVENCDRIVTLTKWYEHVLLNNGINPSKIVYIPQGLPMKSSTEIIKPSRKAGKAISLVFLGRISPFKGLDILIDSISSLPEDKIELDIYGVSNDDAYERECKEKTASKRNIRWKGHLPQQQVFQTLKKYEALCLCSTFSEMSPLVIQEAFAAGIPVIASNVYGNAEQIIDGTNGLLFQFKSVTSLRTQLIRCINDPSLLIKLGLNLPKPRSFEVVANDYSDLYQTLMNGL